MKKNLNEDEANVLDKGDIIKNNNNNPEVANADYSKDLEIMHKNNKDFITHDIPPKKNNINCYKNKQSKINLSRNVRWFIFYVLTLVTIMVNMDHGTIPAATEEIKTSLDQGDDVLGLFGSLVFLGNILGAFICFSIINWVNRKYLLVFSLIFNGILLYIFTLIKIYWLLFIDRILVGICQSFVSIYLPVWCDQFGIKKKKPIMISIIQAGSPLGVVFGYLLTAFLKLHLDWTYSFIVQAILSGVLSLIILFVPQIYFSSTLNSERTDEDNRSVNANINQQRMSQNFSVYNEQLAIVANQNSGFFNNFCKIIKQKVFLFSALALSNLFFIITAIQYWASDYEKNIFRPEDENQIFLSFAIVCITSPTLGLFFGGFISSKTGGYEAKHSILICFIFGLLAGLVSIPVPFANDIFTFTLLLWIVLFFGGAILPNIIGIIMTSLPHHLRGSANSMTNVITNLFGYLPAPAAYGFIYNNTKNFHPRIAMIVIMYSSFIGAILLILAMYFRYAQVITDQLIENRKTSLISNGSQLTHNLAKLFNPNSAINVQNFEQTTHDFEDEDSSDSSNNLKGEKPAPIDKNLVKDGYQSNNDFKVKNKGKKKKSADNKTSKNNNKRESSKDKVKISDNSFAVEIIEENSEMYNSKNLLNSKNYGINNISYDSRMKKDSQASNDSTLDIMNTKDKLGKIGANPNFNYRKYLQDNIFNNSDHDSSENKKINVIDNLSDKNKKSNFNNGGNMINNFSVPMNMGFPISIKTPNFNFVNQNENNFSNDEYGKMPDSNSNKNEKIFMEKEIKFDEEKNSRSNAKQNISNNIINKNDVVNFETDSSIKFSYESTNNLNKEFSLFNPIRNIIEETKKDFDGLDNIINNSKQDKDLNIALASQNNNNQLISKEIEVLKKANASLIIESNLKQTDENLISAPAHDSNKDEIEKSYKNFNEFV